MSVLERGGNTADAAVATGFALPVVESHLNGPGGEVPILLWDPATEQVQVIDGQGVLAQGADIDHYRDLGLELMPETGLLAATVPGAVGAWLLLARRGTWSVRDVLEPAAGHLTADYVHVVTESAKLAFADREAWYGDPT